jgi:hypothetical protein
VHHELLFGGVLMLENMDLRELARDRVYEFLYLNLTERIRGATGSPVRPIAIRRRASGPGHLDAQPRRTLRRRPVSKERVVRRHRSIFDTGRSRQEGYTAKQSGRR